jgi:DNA-binding NtrC family response regulator
VLITGESGTGKEIVAHALHAASARANGTFLSINCGAIPENLLESELFGHERGAYTGATESRKGYFESADHGTLMLDEIGEMPPATQVKLLRVLESGEFLPVGSSNPRRVDVRVVAATNRDLASDVRAGSFRQDLYYRLRAVQIQLPSLRSRPEDVPILFAHFAAPIAARLHLDYRGLTPEAEHLLAEYSWPGNVRELRNLVETVMQLERPKLINREMIERYLAPPDPPRQLPVHLPGRTPAEAERELIYRALLELKHEITSLRELVENQARSVHRGHAGPSPIPNPEDPATVPRIDELERRAIAAALSRNGNSRRRAAHALGISERTLYRKLKEYGGQTG